MEKETGVFIDLKYFQEKILDGEFDESEKYLSAFTNITDSQSSMKMFFQIRKQKYLEALDRNDKAMAVEILVKDFKIFSTYNNDIYSEIINLITLDNFRENVKLSHYKDVKSIRIALMEELKNMIDNNPILKNKIMLPSLRSLRLRFMINHGLNWQYPKPNPESTTLLIDHTSPLPQQGFHMPPMLPAADASPLPPASAWVVNGNPSSSSQSPATLAASSVPGPSSRDVKLLYEIDRLFIELMLTYECNRNSMDPKVFISRLFLEPSDTRISFKFRRRQFPLSLKHVGVYLPSPGFSYGQLYVALSRVTSKEGLKILISNDDGEDDCVTSNVVYREPLPPASAWVVNGNPSSSSQSPATLAASSLPGPSSRGSISKLSFTLNTPLAPMDYQSNDRVQQLRPLLAAESVEKVASTVTPQPSPRLFDEIPRTVVWELNQGSTVKSMEFHPTNHSILAVGCENGEISLWEARMKEKLISKSFNIWNLSNCSVKFQVMGCFQKHLIHLYAYQVSNGLQQHLEINAHDGGVNDLAFSFPKNQLCVVSCGDDKLIKVTGKFPNLNGEKIFSFEGHVAPVCLVVPHSKRNILFLFSTSIDGKIRVWLFENKSLMVEYDTPGKCSTTPICSSDGTRLFSCGTTTEGDCFLAEWDEDDGVVKRTYSGLRTKYVGMVQFDTAKSRYLAVGADNQIKFWDVDIINVLISTDADGGLSVNGFVPDKLNWSSSVDGAKNGQQLALYSSQC
ncbi:topless-like protein [Medicago truncatula]|uniref:Topless-like protein n=1 Tax=Medicago truncatula TaxID=3880 RepID=G7IQV0_MEDTR|nr:topless-like protein [Medicago truncatula]